MTWLDEIEEEMSLTYSIYEYITDTYTDDMREGIRCALIAKAKGWDKADNPLLYKQKIEGKLREGKSALALNMFKEKLKKVMKNEV